MKPCHLSQLLTAQALKYAARTAFVYKDFGGNAWKTVSWRDAENEAVRTARALTALDVRPQDRLAVFSCNCLQYLLVYHAAWKTRAVPVPFYATSSGEQVQYMLNDAHIHIAFAGSQEQYDTLFALLPVCTCLEKIVVFDPRVKFSPYDKVSIRFDDFLAIGNDENLNAELQRRLDSACDSDMLGILYTSGTTGLSKGVVLTHAQAVAAVAANHEVMPLREDDRVLNFLPFAHIFEMGWSILAMAEGAVSVILSDPDGVLAAMRQTHPTAMCAVPRFWEKVYAAAHEKAESLPPALHSLFRRAVNVGYRRNVLCRAAGKRPSAALELEYRLMDRLVLAGIRKQIGLTHPNFFPVAGAFVSTKIEAFVHAIGIFMMVGYGLTESFATVSSLRTNMPFAVGSIGRILPGLNVKIGVGGEILLSGPTITQGYFNRPDINAQSFTPDGFFRTGDAGYFKNGELYITERIKDLFKTSNGKYIAPQMIEAKLLADPFIEMAAVIADDRKFVSALIVPAERPLRQWASENGLGSLAWKELCAGKLVAEMMAARIDALQRTLAPYERIKRFTLLHEPFSAERQEMTSTMKIRRAMVARNYKTLIDKMYAE
ncbi:MAG: long-chain fatty acid--CoA ligase [Prevotella sp.]|nr:long-chain fatty acid--CoA ligase [Prevotella sp.]